MGTSGRLGVVLHAEDGKALVPQSLEGLVVQIDVSGLDVGGERIRVDGEPVILGRDFDSAGRLVADGVVGSPVAELELERGPAERLAEELMSQADSKDRDRGLPPRCGSTS